MKPMIRALGPVLALSALPAAASAHVVLTQTEAQAGAYHAAVFRVGHGCGEAATTAITVHLPEGVPTPRPQPKAGWTLEYEHAPLAEPLMDHGRSLTERISAVTWRGRLDGAAFDDFALLLKLPEQAGDLVLPVTQTCDAVQVRWDQVVGDHPAPVLHLTSAAPTAHSHH